MELSQSKQERKKKKKKQQPEPEESHEDVGFFTKLLISLGCVKRDKL